MNQDNRKVVTAAQMTTLEQASERSGTGTDTLMEQAGLAVAAVAREQLGRQPGGFAGADILVLVGPGNNGADGLVAARHLRRWGAEVTAYLVARRPDPELEPQLKPEPGPESNPNPNPDSNQNLNPDPRSKLESARRYGVSILAADEDHGLAALDHRLSRSRLIIDAVLGTGRSRPLTGLVREVMLRLQALRLNSGISEANRPLVLALDLPTGLDADTGAVDSACPAADVTLALGFPKAGLLAFPGVEHVGELLTLDIGLPPGLGEADIPLELLTPDWVGRRLPERPLNAHKGTFGHLLVVAGSRNYVGAACLVALAAARTGAGLVTLAAPESVYPIAAAQLTEIIHLPLPEDDAGRLHPDAAGTLRELLPRYSCLAVGSGMGWSAGTTDFLERLLLDAPPSSTPGAASTTPITAAAAESPKLTRVAAPVVRQAAIPTVIDADGLNNLSRLPNWWQRRSGPLALTPHPGEMATLTGQTTAAVQQNRVAAARRWAAFWQAVVVLKGACTAIANPGRAAPDGFEPDGFEPDRGESNRAGPNRGEPDLAALEGLVRLSPFANPGLASGGTGDVLTGIIGGLLAQGLSPFDAASCGVYLHGRAAETLTARRGNAGILASDLIDCLPETIKQIRNSR